MPWVPNLQPNIGATIDGDRLFNEEELWPEHRFASVLLIEKNMKQNPEVINKWLKHIIKQ
jgi:hypothetical protein